MRWATPVVAVTLSSLPIYTVNWVECGTMAARENFFDSAMRVEG